MPEPNTHAWQFFLTAEDAWDAMYRDCQAAQSSIEMEQYIFGDDAVGRRFLQLFIRKARRGVRVLLICDKFGSASLFGSPLVRALRRRGGRFYFYNPITRWNLLTPWRWFPRTHVKTLLVDGKIAHVGSACLAQRMETWRDTQIRIDGPVTAQIAHAFAALEAGLTRKQSAPPAPPPQDGFRYVTNQPRLARRDMYREMTDAIRRAERNLDLATGFFAPHLSFFDLLKETRARGVEIRLIVTARSDVPPADWVCLSYGARLFDAGVRVFLYQGRNLHCKTAIVDGNWATAGSANLDVLSFFHNREGNVVITDARAVAEMKRQFQDDLAHCVELTPEAWRALPRWKLLAGYLARALKVFL